MHWMVDFEDGEMVECSSCQGWDASETGYHCLTCQGEGMIWEPLPMQEDDASEAQS